MLVYKILRREEWVALERDGATEGAPIDLAQQAPAEGVGHAFLAPLIPRRFEVVGGASDD